MNAQRIVNAIAWNFGWCLVDEQRSRRLALNQAMLMDWAKRRSFQDLLCDALRDANRPQRKAIGKRVALAITRARQSESETYATTTK